MLRFNQSSRFRRCFTASLRTCQAQQKLRWKLLQARLVTIQLTQPITGTSASVDPGRHLSHSKGSDAEDALRPADGSTTQARHSHHRSLQTQSVSQSVS